jgi:FixJ family two-component response regulator
MNREARAQLKVLIVEPNEFYRSTYSSILHSLGFKRVKTEVNASDGMQSIRLGRANLLIVGDKLEPQSGCAFVAEIRHMGDDKISQLPIVLISDHPDVAVVRAARDAGVNEILASPVSAKAMEARVLSAIDNPRAFVEVKNYVGPDRRRRRGRNYDGRERRHLRGDDQARDKSAS